MNIAERLTENSNRDIDLPHPRLPYGRMQIAGILHDLRLNPTPNSEGTLFTVLSNHAVKKIRRGISRHKIRRADAYILLLRQQLPRVRKIEMRA